MIVSARAWLDRQRRRPSWRPVRVLVLLSALLAALLALGVNLGPGSNGRPGLTEEDLEDAQRVEQPVYTARLSDGALLTVASAYAIPDAADAARASLHGVRFRADRRRGLILRGRADRGLLNLGDERFFLFGNVQGEDAKSVVFRGSSLVIDNASGRVWSEEPVELRWLGSSLQAGSMRVERIGDFLHMKFHGDVRYRYAGAGRRAAAAAVGSNE